jgi:hypothetical protein
MRRRAEEEAANLRDAASSAARRLTEEAERHAVQVRAEAEREASEKTSTATRRVEKLQSAESKLRQRLYALEMMLQSMRQELESDEARAETGGDGAAPASVAAQGGLLRDSAEPPSPPLGDDMAATGGDEGDEDADLELDAAAEEDEEPASRPPAL